MQHEHSHYDSAFVILSIVVATLSAFVALDLIRSVGRAKGLMRAVWYICGAIAMGTGIWSMHFIGMLAHHAPGVTISYDIVLMVVSIVVAVGTSGFALWLMSTTEVSRGRILFGAVAMTFGIGGMHYLGMFSMQMAARIEWNISMVAASFALALVLSSCSFLWTYRVPAADRTFGRQAVSAMLLGAAIAGLHYVGMEAATYVPVAEVVDHSESVIASSALVSLTIFSTFFILFLALIGSVVERAFASQEIRQREARVASELKTQFLATMSHEIRTPLASIIGFSDLLLQKSAASEDPEKKLLYLETIRRCAGALSHLIDDILDLSKIELGHLELEIKPIDLSALLEEEVLTILRIRAESKGVELLSTAGANVPQFVVTDSARIRQILVNLIGNAIKFTNHGSVSLKTEVRDDKLCFEVSDTGIGIDASKFDTLFQPFSQADSSMSRIYGGTGLGLDISRRLARALGGDIELMRSGLGVGSTFLVTTPLKVAVKPAELAPQASLDLSRIKDRRVLLVDDNIDNQVFISHLLRSNGVQVEIAGNGREGVAKAMTNEFDVIFMDLQMPIMNGYEATKALRDHGRRTPILALTAHATREDRELCRQAGCDGYLTKPVDTRLLLKAISDYSGRSTTTDAPTRT